MFSFTASAITLGLAALSSALPPSERAPQSTTEVNDFAIGLIAEGYPVLTLNAIQSGTLGNLDLVFERPSAYPGTPAYFSGTYLDFKLINDPNPYATYFEDVGDDYGFTVPVTAIYAPGQDNGRDGFTLASDGSINARMTAALQSFFACNSTLNGVDQFSLKWGVFKSDGGAPDGCVAAKLVQGGPGYY
ncbi:hypothetical protein N431DRAFT_557498 [Stipitochalara longipes BDJ]|nr:hypothetical protein N431DRAFT_557498 [Stipitochalara longipes BDJ]